MTKPQPKLCAIYTRKSSEEGLAQNFNSLDAQREACEAYIKSQAQEGWKLVRDRYDDGGFSGGTLDRPALQDLLQDIRDGRVDVIVVYKIDRLTRSLMDFSKLVELLDQHKVSFVSVTQHFNTTTSMGRLTLNVLLSFAQFEREVTGERIRDKFLASRKKGMWMGGHPPPGYDLKDRKLVPNPNEVEEIRTIFSLYLETGCVRRLSEKLEEVGIRSKRRVSAAGRHYGGRSISRGRLYALLQNRLYIGEAVHKGKAYPGEHEAIIDLHLWNRVQKKLASHRLERTLTQGSGSLFPLKGLLFHETGAPFTPIYSQKKNGVRYRYYVCHLPSRPAIRMKALEIESLISEALQGEGFPNDSNPAKIRNHIEKIVWKEQECVLEVYPRMAGKGKKKPFSVFAPQLKKESLSLINGTKPTKGLAPQIDRGLIKALARAWSWREAVERDEVASTADIAAREPCSQRYVRKLLPLAFLSPNIIEAVFLGARFNPEKLDPKGKAGVPLVWEGK